MNADLRGPAMFPGSFDPLTSPCPDNSFLNSQTGNCETFANGTPPPPLPANVPWTWKQWALLAAGVGIAALVIVEIAKQQHSHKALVPGNFDEYAED